MKFLKKMKDGGVESTVTGYWLVEIKSLFSIVLLKFEGKSRDAYHGHAFHCLNWLLRGKLYEDRIWQHTVLQENHEHRIYEPSWKPFFIFREDFHKVDSIKPVSWVLSFRGPWAKTWEEYLPNEGKYRTLTDGRIEV